jgi:hypothetical protein
VRPYCYKNVTDIVTWLTGGFPGGIIFNVKRVQTRKNNISELLNEDLLMNKKLVSLALATSLVAGSMSLGFAAGDLTANIEDKDVVSAVERLAAFGIIDGMDDGKYHPELDVTREQFAKVLVEALGLGTAADAAKGATQFADVEAGRWSAGYVNVAVGQGILKGYPDGTFKPANKVTYAEAVTMLVRALGYQDEFLPGTWPGNYVAKAADEGITDDVVFSPKGTADRGSMAVMVNNTLDADVVRVDEYGTLTGTEITYRKVEVSLLEEKLDIKKYDSLRFVKNQRLDDTLDSDEVVFMATKNDTKLLTNEEDKGEEFSAVEIADSVDTEALLGMKVKAYVNDDDEVVYMEKDGTEKVVIDMIDAIDKEDDDDITLFTLDNEFQLDTNAKAFVAGVNDDIKTVNDADDFAPGNLGRFVVSGDEIVFADVVTADVTDNTGMVVTDLDKNNMEITGIVGDGASEPTDDKVIDLEDDYDEHIIVNAVTRESLSFDDIAVDDVVYVTAQEIDGDDYAIVHVVKNNKVEGELGRYKSDEIKIDDTTYELSVIGEENTWATFSVNENDDVESYAAKFDDDELIKDAYGENIVAITDAVGRVIHFSTDAEATSEDLYGVVDKVYDQGERVKLYLASEDDTVTYDVEDDDDAANLVKGQFIKFKLNKDGEIAEDEVEIYDGDVYQVKDEFGKDTIETEDGTTFSVDEDSTILVNAPDGTGFDDDALTGQSDIDDLELVKWSDIAEDDSDAQFVAFFDANKELDAVLFVKEVDSVSDEEAVYVVDTFKSNGDKVAEVDFYGTGIEELVVDSASEDDIEDEMVAVVKKQSDGEIEFISFDDSEDFELVSGTVTEKDGDFIYVNDDEDNGYKLSTSTVVYDEDDKKSKSNISEGDFVDLVVEDGRNVRVVELLEEEPVPVLPAEKVENMIDDLPTVANLTLDDAEDVEDARTAYDALTADQKADVDNLADLVAAEAQIAVLEAEAGAEAVVDMIDALPAIANLTIADLEDVEDARTAYDALTAEQQAEVDNIDDLVDAETQMEIVVVVDMIDALPAVADLELGDEADVVAARTAYDALTAEQQAEVEAATLAVLVEAEAQIVDLQADLDAVNGAADAAAMNVVLVDLAIKYEITDYIDLDSDGKDYIAAAILAEAPFTEVSGVVDAVWAEMDDYAALIDGVNAATTISAMVEALSDLENAAFDALTSVEKIAAAEAVLADADAGEFDSIADILTAAGL